MLTVSEELEPMTDGPVFVVLGLAGLGGNNENNSTLQVRETALYTVYITL